MSDMVSMEPIARTWLTRTDSHVLRLGEALIWAQESEHERCYEIASRLEEVLKAMEADRAATAAALGLLTARDSRNR